MSTIFHTITWLCPSLLGFSPIVFLFGPFLMGFTGKSPKETITSSTLVIVEEESPRSVEMGVAGFIVYVNIEFDDLNLELEWRKQYIAQPLYSSTLLLIVVSTF